MEATVVALPWQLQLALGAGYAAYIIAYSGIRDHHKGADIAFRSIAFGLVTPAAFAIMPAWVAWVQVAVAVTATVAAGLLWRFLGMAIVSNALRRFDVSWADDVPSAWTTVAIQNSRHRLSQIAVQMDDGSWLYCDDTSGFAVAPFGPCRFGLNGDVALYVTSEEDAAGTVTHHEAVQDAAWGDRITFVPASKVKRVALRYL